MKIFNIDDCEWWMAPDIETAIRDYQALTGYPIEEPGDVRELTEVELDRLQYMDEQTDADRVAGIEVTRTFREEMQRRLDAGGGSQFFATTEF